MKTPTATKHLKKPRGRIALEEAEAGVENLIRVAYNLRTKKSRLLAVEATNESQDIVVAGTRYISPAITGVSLSPIIQDVKPSSILNDLTTLDVLLKTMDSRDIILKTKTFHAWPVTLSTS